MDIIDFKDIYTNFMTTEVFAEAVEALGFRILTDRGVDKLRIVAPYGEDKERETLIAMVDTRQRYKVLIYWDEFNNVLCQDGWIDDGEIKLADKLYTLLYLYGMTPEEYRGGRLPNE